MNLYTILKILITYCFLFISSAQANHWQGRQFTDVLNFGGEIKPSGNIWQWYPSSVVLHSDILDMEVFSISNSGLIYQTERGAMFTILEGRTSGLISKPKLGIQPAIVFANSDVNSLHLPVKGVLSNGQHRYGEVKLNFRHVSAYHDSTLNEGWISRTDLSDKEKDNVISLMKNVNGYAYHNKQNMNEFISNLMFNGGFDELSDAERTNIAGAWLTTIKDVCVFFPGAEEGITQWQGWISPIVVYF
ncbi:TPA: hypothetical protein PRY54_003928 [Escherichia coli]|uniref:F4 family fimbrial subunit n=1 Tax=Salmonella enterica TaxID=28901 RepID=UPI00112F2777|nr:hypothetical protein [Salmonella enterica]ECI7782069.1 hypothetical protein [Salmonella enterica subsp. enterica]EDV7203867.1 hypothetical protein [Salmonella enterica subsp. enterica serovar Bredeney]MBS9213431.1 hypothetical protein [Escherichia coli]HAI6890246.1 hypothetical protein [Escherichia coli]HDK2666226.1 hypothetical protein [Escherichia coli]